MNRTLVAAMVAVLVIAAKAAPVAQSSKTYDELLDLYVRDGFVYYRALKSDRAKLDAYVNQLAAASPDQMARDEQVAFWINAYNALVLRTVIDHYPIAGHAAAYPAKSVRQIPGAFERLTHKAGGRTITLDQIEQTVLAPFKDPRVFFALGRGSQGGGRLRSEAYAAANLETQLAEAASECISRQGCVNIDREQDKVVVSSIFGWREKEFVAAYADKADAQFAPRSPIERAALAFVYPRLLTTEKEYLEKGTFKVQFGEFDWHLNDLTGRGGR